MSLTNIFGAVVLVGLGLVILLHPDKFRFSFEHIRQFISRYWWISVFICTSWLFNDGRVEASLHVAPDIYM